MTGADPLDEDFLEAWSREQQAEAWRRQQQDIVRCPACKHAEHGVVCSFTQTWTTCECPSSFWGQVAS